MSERDRDRSQGRARRILERLTGSSRSLDESLSSAGADLEASELVEHLADIERLFLMHGGERDRALGPSKDEVLFEWGHLQALESLGQGSFGEVFRAYDRTLDRDVALKLLKTDQARPFQSQLFLHEARQLAMVRHRHVLAVHGAAVHAGRPGLWTDLIDGATAQDASLQPLFSDPAEVLDLVESLARAVQAVHNAGLVHGDIKPSNLMRDADGDWVLMDFGASRAARSGGEGPSLTSGTPLYMAPEVVLGNAPDQRADLYSVGATLYRVLDGAPPFDVKEWADLRSLHQQGRRPRPARVSRDAGGRIGRLIDRLMAFDPDQRPGPADVLAEVQAIREAPHKRFRRLALGGIAAVLVVGLVATSIGFYRADRAREAAELEQRNTAGVNRFLQRVLATPSTTGRVRDMTVEQMLLQAAADVGPALLEQAAARAVVHRVLAESFNTLRLPAQARDQIEIARKVIADAGLSMPAIERGLALQSMRALEIEDRHEDSIALADAFITEHLDALGDEHQDIRWARMYQVTNRFALSEYEEARVLMDTHFTDIPDPETAEDHFGYEILQSRANLQAGLGQYEAAAETAERALDWLERYPLARPINRSSAMTNLALSLGRINRTDRAIEVLEALLPLEERMFGRSSADYVATLINLAALKRESGDVDASGEILQQALALIEAEPDLVPDEQKLVVQMNLANVFNATDRSERAEAIMRQAHRQAVGLWGASHQHVVTLEYNLAELLSQQGRHDEARALAERTLATKQSAFGESHPLTLLTMDNLAVALAGLDRGEEALELHDRALALLAEQLGSEHPFALLVERHRLATLQDVAPERIEPDAIERLVRRHEAALGGDHPDTDKARRLSDS
ncbi:serine/threonine-protein kinase [Halomonas denitrificans]|nr:serine/threonine-protein kinase [Halomonas denitrificans]